MQHRESKKTWDELAQVSRGIKKQTWCFLKISEAFLQTQVLSVFPASTC